MYLILLAYRNTSAVVGEVENMKKNRTDRRAKQEEVRGERERLKKQDPGNPHWEFALMIK